MKEPKEEENKRTGLIASIGIHALLLLIFAFFGMSYTVPPPEEEGITINFGTSEQGMMTPNPTVPTPQESQVEPETEVTEPVPEKAIDEDIITQDVEDSPSIDKKEKEKEEKVEPVKKKEEPKPDQQLSSAIDKWKKKKSEEGGGDGNTNQIGDQGNINGDPNSKNYEGGGAGNGLTFSLAGRSLVSRPKISDNSQEEGTVVVDIIVDQYGKVIRATPGARGSTTTNSILMKKAKEAALKTRFNANPDAAEEQKGQMTFIFILN